MSHASTPPESPPASAPASPDPIAALTRRLGYGFRDTRLLHEALTHRSYHNERKQRAPRHNERLEFLGDAVLGASVTAMLFERLPDVREGELTRRRAELVCEAGLAELADELGLGEALLLGRGEERSGGRRKPRLLASGVEALVGAVHQDGGFEAAVALVQRLLGPRLGETRGERDHKTTFQEWAQRHHGLTPRYELLDTDGPDHARSFRVALYLGEQAYTSGEGRSKTEAEQDAARAALVLAVELAKSGASSPTERADTGARDVADKL
ncbi:MAG: ribonuclease III [Polyangiales bacterium]|nr:ribonuclease III [Myxococcales bacterium]